jgi:hypothetical protein
MIASSLKNVYMSCTAYRLIPLTLPTISTSWSRISAPTSTLATWAKSTNTEMYHSKLLTFSYVSREPKLRIFLARMSRYAGDWLGGSLVAVGEVMEAEAFCANDCAAEEGSGADSRTRWARSCCTIDCKLCLSAYIFGYMSEERRRQSENWFVP